ncbi:MAG: chorismate mutase [Euryarchaeota archaeon]|nr:chorismate mutase [Euryarchaeota archaeon]
MGLEEYRREIDAIDGKIIELLEDRFRIIGDIARVKKAQGQAIYDAGREEEVRQRWREALRDLDREFVDGVVDLILRESKRVQERVK